MKSKTNKKQLHHPQNFFIGAFKGEVQKVRGLWNQIQRRPRQQNQVDTVTLRKICAPIPSDQARQAAKARGEEIPRDFYNTVLTIRII